MTDPVIQLAIELMERESVTPKDAGCQALIAERLSAVGFEVTDYSHKGITNTWYTHGSGEPCLIFSGHTDVVPPGDEGSWLSPPFEPTLTDDGFLRGRGACDMKGSVAAMVVAFERFVTNNPNHKGTLALALTSDEEGPAENGMRHLIEQLPTLNNAFILTGEPTSVTLLGDTMKPGRRGSMHGTITVHGEQMHVGYAKENKNSIHLSAALLERLNHLCWPAADGFSETRIQCYAIHADAHASNVVPANTTIQWNCRYGVTPGAEAIIKDVTKALADTEVPHTLDVTISSYPFLTPLGALSSAIEKAVMEHTGTSITPSTSGGTSDSRFWAAKGYPVIDFGPVNKTIHQVNECVEIKELSDLTRVYTSIISDFLV